MHSGWVRWIAYLVLAALVVVTSCRALTGGEADAAVQSGAQRTVQPVVQSGATG